MNEKDLLQIIEAQKQLIDQLNQTIELQPKAPPIPNPNKCTDLEQYYYYLKKHHPIFANAYLLGIQKFIA